ncbi:MAG: DUF115 domain-containing protein [Desulfovibrio sp.]|nr:DUF115 domain-containing protein [Desulfovibrio sp.]MBI4957949.1 DUF115 domain-containing protein [Desulfovibrio sp.]
MSSLAIFQELGILAIGSRTAGSVPIVNGLHVFHHHSALWDYCDPKLANPFVPGAQDSEVFATLPPGTTLTEAMAHSRFLVFIGARSSPELQAALARTDGVCLIFEPDLDQTEAFLSDAKPSELAQKAVFIIGGDPDSLDVPLLSMLPEDVCRLGYPLFFVLDGLADVLPKYIQRVEELIELFYYRNFIYQLDSQENVRGLPLRPMTRDYIYDRLKHQYENLEPCLRSGTLEDLLGAFTGHTAILVAAGPALLDCLKFIRENLDRTVVIAVNNALKPLLAEGIEPHFVVINDTSVDSEVGFTGLSPLKRASLVAHCLCGTGDSIFPNIYFFGNFPGQPFPKRKSLLLHGSVITTAFSLAEYLGCTKAVLAGVQLASPDPMTMNYAKGSAHEARCSEVVETDLPGRWPQLYPVTTADNRTFYTTLNFFDAAQWFADRIRMASLEVVNLCPASILKGPGIEFDPSPPLPEAPGLAAKLATLSHTDISARRGKVLDYLSKEMARWKKKQLAAREAAKNLNAATSFITGCDNDNTSFMLQRFEDFDNMHFHTTFFCARSDKERADGAVYFLERMSRMCTALLKILLEQHRRIAAMQERTG